ncbi:PAS domain-containing sensor histidine kinase [Hymenobacter sp.]|jgi:two-component system sensor histidine kinase VicK|uniref:PAS domain-containing sensor histidine kinase n=1 Tax=Hymenobacter sp. TaxID=1898978 RepID=UPI002ED8A1A4
MSDFAALFDKQAEASAHIHFVYDVEAHRVVFINPAYEHVLHGHLAEVNEELPGLLACLHPDDYGYLMRYWKLWVRGRASDEIEVRLQQVGQPEQWFCLSPYQQQTGSDAVLVAGVLRDISVAKRYQYNADTYNTKKNATLEILSYDLGGAFVLVQQIAEYLREELQAPAESRVPEMLRVLETTSRNSVKMIRDLVNIEFLSSANTDLKRDRVEVGGALRLPLEELQRGQRLLGHEFTYALPAEPVYVNLDVNKFTQVLTNLISNAIKFTPDGGHITVQINSYPNCVRIQVVDDGIGIPEVLQPYLFERFTKARRPGLRGEDTTGLGLMLCKTIVEWHEGSLSVASTEGQGSTFTVEIPLADL